MKPILAAGVVGVTAASAYAVFLLATQSVSLPLAPFGDSIGGAAGQVVPLSSTSFIASVKGADNDTSTADDKTMLVTKLDTGTPVVTPLDTPFLADYSGEPLRISATRVLYLSAGPDGSWSNADDEILMIDRIGSANTVVHITVGPISSLDAHRPAILDTNTVALVTRGVNGSIGNSDDTIALITDLSGTPTVTQIPAPFLIGSGSSRVVALSSTSFLVNSEGPDSMAQTVDDVTYLFTGVGTTNTRADLATPRRINSGPGLPVPLSPTRAVVCGRGLDAVFGTADDELHLLDNLATVPAVSTITVPSIMSNGGGRAVPASTDAVLVSTQGPNSAGFNADDTIAFVQGLGSANPTVTHITIGFLSEDAASRAVFLAPGVFAVGTAGPDADPENADDQVAVVFDLFTGPVVQRHSLSGLDAGQSSMVMPLGPASFLVSNGGPDGMLNDGGDDRFSIVTDALVANPVVEHVDMDGENNTFWASQLPQYLGDGRAAVLSGGADQMITSGADDVFQVLSGLPSTRALRQTKTTLTFNPAKPEKGERATVSATLELDSADLFGGLSVTLSVGNAAQLIPIADIQLKKGIYSYSDAKGAKGFIRRFSYNTKNKKLTISAKGVGTGIETTSSLYIPVAIEGNDVYLGQVTTGTETKSGIKFKAP